MTLWQALARCISCVHMHNGRGAQGPGWCASVSIHCSRRVTHPDRRNTPVSHVASTIWPAMRPGLRNSTPVSNMTAPFSPSATLVILPVVLGSPNLRGGTVSPQLTSKGSPSIVTAPSSMLTDLPTSATHSMGEHHRHARTQACPCCVRCDAAVCWCGVCARAGTGGQTGKRAVHARARACLCECSVASNCNRMCDQVSCWPLPVQLAVRELSIRGVHEHARE